jgi:hypothetical protein
VYSVCAQIDGQNRRRHTDLMSERNFGSHDWNLCESLTVGKHFCKFVACFVTRGQRQDFYRQEVLFPKVGRNQVLFIGNAKRTTQLFDPVTSFAIRPQCAPDAEYETMNMDGAKFRHWHGEDVAQCASLRKAHICSMHVDVGPPSRLFLAMPYENSPKLL